MEVVLAYVQQNGPLSFDALKAALPGVATGKVVLQLRKRGLISMRYNPAEKATMIEAVS